MFSDNSFMFFIFIHLAVKIFLFKQSDRWISVRGMKKGQTIEYKFFNSETNWKHSAVNTQKKLISDKRHL